MAPGRRAVVFADNDDAFRTAADLADAGVEVAALVDARRILAERAGRGRERKSTLSRGRRHRRECAVGQSVKGVEITDANGKIDRIDCDLLAVSGGWNPTVHLTTHLNGRPVWSECLSALVPGKLPPGMSVAGAAAGQFGLASCLAGGDEAGR